MIEHSDHITFNKIFSQYKNAFIRFAYSYLKDEYEAENIVMDSFLYYWEHKDDLSHELNIPAYIFTIIKHKCLNHLKHYQIKEKASSQIREQMEWDLQFRMSSLESCDPTEIFQKETKKQISDALHKLPQKTRHIFLMNRLGDKSYADIAMSEKMSVKNVEYHISKALKILRTNLKDVLHS